MTDDSAALLAALASGNPVRLGAKTYAIAGECDISAPSCTLLGVPGLTELTRPAQSKLGTSSTAAWISISSQAAFIDGIIFDANSAIATDSYAVAIQSSCTKSIVTRCLFRNAKGPTNGSGLTYVASDPAITQHHVDDCEFTGNAAHGIFIQASDAFSITNSRAHDNSGNGIHADSQDPTFSLKIRELHVVGNTCWNNNCGILVGNFNSTNNSAFVYGNANPDILAAIIASNNTYSNREYGIFMSGRNILVSGNLCTNNNTIGGGGAGILCDTGYCKVSGNYVNGASVGVNIGGGQYCTARDNFIQDCTGIGIGAQNVESNGRGSDFNLACTGLSIIGNWIAYTGEVFAILVRDAAQNILIADNVILAEPGADMTRAISAYTDTVIIRGNVLNFTTRWSVNPTTVSGLYTLVVPDVADAVTITQSLVPVTSIITAAAQGLIGQIAYCKVVNGGSGYTTASISFNGTGTGQTAEVWLSGGAVIGIQITNWGSGYGPGTTATITGDGTGATVTVQVGLPVWQGKQLSIDCLTPVTFGQTGTSPAQSNWTGAPITIPAGGTIDWIGTNGGWRAARFSQSDYVSPNGDGSVTLKTRTGDISLHPAGTGVVRLISDTESTGAVELIGRGSPLNVISAPPGSTFRNLNGGVGSTFWVKQAGTGSANWVAVA